MMETSHSEAGFNLDRELAAKAFKELLATPSRGRIWIASHVDEQVGYIVLTYRFSMESGGIDAHIEDIYVRTGERRNGVGSRLLTEAIKRSEEDGLKAIHVETGSDDLRAIQFYRRHNLLNRGRTFMTVEITENKLAKPK